MVKVTKESIFLLPYSQLDRLVWQNSVIDRDFSLIQNDQTQNRSIFYAFLKDLSVADTLEKSNDRLKSLQSAIGYLIHRYKDASNAKAIILMDVFRDGQPNGGSGKTLLMKALSKVRVLDVIDGKRFNSKNQFEMSSIRINS